MLQQRDRYVASVHEIGADRPVCEEPKTPCSHDECGWDYIDDTSGELLKNRAGEISVIRGLGVWEVVDRPRDEVVFGPRRFYQEGRRRQTFLPRSSCRASKRT